MSRCGVTNITNTHSMWYRWRTYTRRSCLCKVLFRCHISTVFASNISDALSPYEAVLKWISAFYFLLASLKTAGWAEKSVNPDQRRLIGMYTIWSGLSVRLLRVNTVLNISTCNDWFTMLKAGTNGYVGCTSNWRSGGRRFDRHRIRQHSFVNIALEMFSAVILSLQLSQEGQLSVCGERMLY